MINNSSVGQYTNCRYKDDYKMLKSNVNATIMEEMVVKELEAGIDGIAKIISNIRKLIAPVINVAHHEQLKKDDINLIKVTSFEDILWQSNISVNTKTASFQTENDSTYTVSSIPKQENQGKMNRDSKVLFKN